MSALFKGLIMKFFELFEATSVDALLEDMGSFQMPAPDAGIPTDQQLELAVRQFSAARRALGLVNKLAPGPTKQRHASRVLAVLNKIRASIRRIEKQITVELGA